MPVVAMPDGAQVSFPDDMQPDQIRSMILQKFPDAAKSASSAEAPDHGLSERQKLSPIEKALSPITSYPETYNHMNRESRDQMSRGAGQLASGVFGHGLAGDVPEFVSGVGNVALGALGYVASPINAAYRSVMGQPVEDVTGIPREYTEFAAQLATPGIGLSRLPGKPGAPVNPSEYRPASEVYAERPPAVGTDVLQAQERLREAGYPVDVPRSITSDSVSVQRSGEHLSNVPFVGDPLKKAFHERVPQQMEVARDAVAAEYGAGTGPNAAHRAGNVLKDAATAETRAATDAARSGDDAVLAAHQRAADDTVRQIGEFEGQSLERARAAVGDMSPQDMGQALIERLRQSERAAHANKERLYGVASQSDGAIDANAVRSLRADVGKALDEGGAVVDPVLTPAASRMMAELDNAPLRVSGDMARRQPVDKAAVSRPKLAPDAPPAGTQEQSLLEFLASKGGLGPDAELGAIGAERHTVGVEGLGRRKLVRQGGMPLDSAREAAEEAGYFRGQNGATTTPRELLDAIDAEIRGQKRYREGAEGYTSKRETAARSEREQHEFEVYNRGINEDLTAAGHGGLGSEVKQRAVQLMKNERLDADSAVEKAFRQLEQEDAAIGGGFPGNRPAGSSGPAVVSMQSLEQTRKRLNAFSRAATNDADRNASRLVIREFDKRLGDAFDNALFSGSDEALQSYRAARAANTEWRQRFGFNARDDADRIINRVVTGEVTPQELSNYIVGASRVGANGVSSRLLTRLREATGNDPDVMQSVRGGVWNRLSNVTEGATAKAPEKVASGIHEFLNGPGRALARELYTPEQQGILRAYADTLRRGQTARELTVEVAKNTKPGATVVEKGPMQRLADRVLGGGQKSDEALYQTISGYTQKGGDIKALAGLLRELPQDMKGDVAASLVRGLGKNRAGQFTIDQFATQWANITPQAKAVLFGNAGPHVTALNDIAIIAQRMKDVKSRYGNPSGTAQNSIFAAIMGLVGGTVGVGAAAGTAALSGAGYVGAKVLASPAGASSLAKHAKAIEREAAAPTRQNQAAVSMTERNLINTVKSLAASRGSEQLPASLRLLQGPVPARAEDEKR